VRKNENGFGLMAIILGVAIIGLIGVAGWAIYDKDSQEAGENVQVEALDLERQTDLQAIHNQIESYYAKSGKYPTLNELNDASWRAANMSGLDEEALKDPAGSSSSLAASSSTNQYSYEPTAVEGSACDNIAVNCAKYILTANLISGPFVKSSLN
jgi:hypothetical protein